MLHNYLKTAWRSLMHNKPLTALNVAGLTMGMTAAVLIFLWVQNELSFDRFEPGADRIFMASTRQTVEIGRAPKAEGAPAVRWEWEGSPMLLAAAAQKEVPGIEKITRLNQDNRPVFQVGNAVQFEKQCAYVDSNWFDMFSYRFIEGSAADFARDAYSLVLTAAEANRYFGKRSAVGQIVRIDSSDFTVKAVVADPPANSSFQYHAFLQIAALLRDPQQRQNGEYWGNDDYRTFVLLKAGVSADAVAAGFTDVFQHYAQDDQHVMRTTLTPLKDIHLDNQNSDASLGRGNIQVVKIFSLLGFVILLVACINYVNLTTAKASLRSREVSIRKIVGAQRWQLFLQFVAESLLISVLALAATLLLVRLCLPAFTGLTGKDLSGSLTSPAIWEVLGATLAAAFVLNSLYPALLLSSFKPLSVFRGVTVLKVNDAYFRKGLVVLQFGVSILLMTGTVVIYRQMRFVQQTNPGYDRSQVLAVELPYTPDPMHQSPGLGQQIHAMQQEMAAHSAIEQVSMVNQALVEIGSYSTGGDWEGRDTSFMPKIGQLSADANLQKTMRLEMAEGRWFREGDKADEQNYILNETAVRELPIHQPVLGQYFKWHGVQGRIIGVVKDFHFKSLHEKVGPLVVFNDPGWRHVYLVRTAPQRAGAAVAAIAAIWKRNLPGTPLQYQFLDEEFDRMYRQDAIAGKLVFIFTVIALGISALGLFGLAAFAAERREREIGIRRVLGATTASIGGLLSREFIQLVAIAILLATPLAWWAMNGWLRNFAYRVGISWWMFALSGGMALLMAVLITGWQAVKAAWKNPVRALRRE
jgi:putative ABC transport system permease protein